MGVHVADPAAFDRAGAKMHRAKLLVFSRWCQVMFRFEKALYENPDQDLNTLWWDLVERYQMVRRPEGRNAARLRQQDSHRERAGLLPQLPDGRALRRPGACTRSLATCCTESSRRGRASSATRPSASS